MSGLIISDKEVAVPGLDIINYKDNISLRLRSGEDKRNRNTRWIRSIVLHNTKNIETIVKEGKGPFKDVGEKVANYWSTDGKCAGAHLVVDWDGTITCHADLLLDAAYHAGTMNENSIGIEIFEDDKGTVYGDQLEAVVNLVEWLCKRFGIQRQMPTTASVQPIKRIITGGRDCVGIFGHRHNTSAKRFDPGFSIFQCFKNVGFKEFDFDKHEDLTFWIDIQRALGLVVDGVPGPNTRDALQARGFEFGLYDWQRSVC
jgi:hypothetical protein